MIKSFPQVNIRALPVSQRVILNEAMRFRRNNVQITEEHANHDLLSKIAVGHLVDVGLMDHDESAGTYSLTDAAIEGMNEDWAFACRTESELREAFDLIDPSKIGQAVDWKEPIDTFIPPEKFPVCFDACVFFTSTVLHLDTSDGMQVFETTGTFHVTADGYRRGPAGDH